MKEFGSYVKSFDTFGVPVSLNIDGQETHKTYTGTFLSLVIFVLMATYTFG